MPVDTLASNLRIGPLSLQVASGFPLTGGLAHHAMDREIQKPTVGQIAHAPNRTSQIVKDPLGFMVIIETTAVNGAAVFLTFRDIPVSLVPVAGRVKMRAVSC